MVKTVKAKSIVTFTTLLLVLSTGFSIWVMVHLNHISGKAVEYSASDTSDIEYSPDGSIYYTTRQGIQAEKDGKVIWNLDTNNIVNSLELNGDLLYVSTDDRKVYVVNSLGDVIKEYPTPYRPVMASGNSDASLIAIASTLNVRKNAINILDGSGVELTQLSPRTVVNTIAVLEKNYIVYSDEDSNLILLDDKQEQIDTASTTYIIKDIDVSADRKTFALLDESGNVYIYDSKLTLLGQQNLGERCSDISIDNVRQRILACGTDGTIKAVDYSGNLLFSATINREFLKLAAAQDEEGTLTLLDYNGTILSYDSDLLVSFNLLVVLSAVSVFVAVISLIFLVFTLLRRSKNFDMKMRLIAKNIAKHKWCYFVITPSLILLIIFCYYPAFSAFILAFTDYKPGVYMRFIGIQNFVSMFKNTYFWSGLGNAGIFLVTDLVKALVPPIIIAELILALRSKKLQYGIRVAMYIPGILPGVAGILVWVTGIFGLNGALNSIIQLFVPSFAQAWIGDPNTALLTLILIGFPWIGSYLIFYGALMSIPASLFESSKMDGCTFVKRVWQIDIPLIRPQIKYIFVTAFIASLQNFTLIYLTTKGGPGHSTYTPSLEMYMNMSQFQNYGEAAAMGLFLFVIIFGATLVNMRMRTSSES